MVSLLRYGSGETGNVLHVVRQLTHKHHPRDRQKLAHLLKAEIVFPFCHFRRHRDALNPVRFIVDLAVDAQLTEQLALYIPPLALSE